MYFACISLNKLIVFVSLSMCVCVCVWILRKTVCVWSVGFNSIQKLAHRVYYVAPNVAKSDI